MTELQEAPAATRPTTSRLCSIVSRLQGDDPAGSAWGIRRMLAVEVPLPWPEDYFQARGFPPGLGDTIEAIWEQDEIDSPGILAIAPDKRYSRDGWTRLLDFTYPDYPRASATVLEYCFPTELMGEVICRVFTADATVTEMPGVEIAVSTSRDMLVCTHGTVDACCAMFGYPLYRDLRRMAENLEGIRVWRASHFGGHRFAATLIDFPEGRYWGFMDGELGEALLRRSGSPAALRDCYRGWAGYEEVHAQILEREALVREGWEWTTWPQQCETLEVDVSGSRLRITAYPPGGAAISYEGVVANIGSRPVMHSTDDEMEEEPLYAVRSLTRSEAL